RSGWSPDHEVAHGRIGDDDERTAFTHVVVEVDDVLVDHADTAGRHGPADGPDIRIAVDAIDRVPVAFVNVERACAQRIVQSRIHAAIRDADGFQLRLARDHLVGRVPSRPFPLVGDVAAPAGPGKAVPADAD